MTTNKTEPLSDLANRSTVRPLPDGWTETPLGDFRVDTSKSINPGKQPNQVFELYSVPSYENRLPEIVPGSEIGSSKRIVQENTVLLCKINPRINRVWIVGNHSAHPKIASTEWIPFDKVESVIPKYLRYFMLQNSFRDFLAQNASGVGGSLMRVKPATFADYSFPIAPLPEQERIVAEIEKQFTRLDQAVASLRRLQSNLARYKASVLKAACEGRLVPQDPADEPASQLLARILAERRDQWQAANPGKKYKEPVGVEEDTAVLPELPEGWQWARAEQICDFITKGTTPKAHKLFSDSGEIPFIKVYNLTFDSSLDFSIKPTFVTRETHEGELSRSRVFPGDVLMNIVGPPLGKVSIVPELHKEWNMNQAVAVFRPMPSYNNRFLAMLLMSEPILRWATKRAKATAGQFNLTLQICRDLPLPIPPLAEQERIVAEVERRLSVVSAVEQTITANLSRAERLRQSILHRAFTGQLVPQESVA